MEQIWWAIPVVLFAGLVRGYSGFGFAAISIIGINLIFAPQQSVAIILAIDILCSVMLLRSALKEANYIILRWLMLGALIGIPIGYSFLLLIPADILKFLICLGILGLCMLLFVDYNPFDAESRRTKLGFGVASGISITSASVGGPMIIYYMLASSISTSQQRATMIVFFLISDMMAIITLLSSGMVDFIVLKAVLILILPTIIAVRIGHILFQRNPPKSLKSFALPVIMMVAGLGGINALFALF